MAGKMGTGCSSGSSTTDQTKHNDIDKKKKKKNTRYQRTIDRNQSMFNVYQAMKRQYVHLPNKAKRISKKGYKMTKTEYTLNIHNFLRPVPPNRTFAHHQDSLGPAASHPSSGNRESQQGPLRRDSGAETVSCPIARTSVLRSLKCRSPLR